MISKKMVNWIPVMGVLLLAVFAACEPVPAQEPERVAEQWVRAAPTYAYDGFDLALQEQYVRESHPEQYVFIYTFTTRAAGYGDRSDEMVAQVLTDREIEVVVIDGEVVSAVIDGVWDELRQEMLAQQLVELSFTPMQCVEYVWDEWYASEHESLAPATEQVISDYYSSQGVDVGAVVSVEMEGAVCMACEICPVGVVYYVSVGEEVARLLEDDGWVRNT